jgi:hypothetical protein
MPRSKKTDAPKFEPVTIAGLRPEIRSLLKSEAETKQMYAEDMSRIKSELGLAIVERLDALQKHLEVPEGNLFALTLAIANKYVPGFVVPIGAPVKTGPKKKAERFKIVTEVDRLAFDRDVKINKAIEMLAAHRRPSITAAALSTKYYAYLGEIKANKSSMEVLMLWRGAMQRLGAMDDDREIFEELFWECESNYLGAAQPHNVRVMKPRKR